MQVERVVVENGSEIQPPLDPNWTDFEKLKWLAAVIKVDSGLDVKIYVDDRIEKDTNSPQEYAANIKRVDGYQSVAYQSFNSLWFSLSDISKGAEIANGFKK